MIQDFSWQEKALESWRNNNHKGIVKAPTGTGKTYLGIEAIRQEAGTVLVVVSTVHLMHQWQQKIKEVLGIEAGLFYSKYKNYDDKIIIGVVNSVRNNWYHSANLAQRDLLILDEVHRYGSLQNIKVLNLGKKVLGLSATPERSDHFNFNLPIVFDIDVTESIAKGMLSKYDLINVGVEFDNIGDKINYQNVDFEFKELFKEFNYNLELLMKSTYRNRDAVKCMQLMNQRKELINNNKSKINKAVEIILNESGNKILVFSEFINTANEIKRLLEEQNKEVLIYHSDMKIEGKQEMIDKFKANNNAVMVSVKALDEGIDVGDCSIGIIVAGNSVSRQAIQRLGRIVRAQPGKVARLYQIFLKNTKDFDWLIKRNEILAANANTVDWR